MGVLLMLVSYFVCNIGAIVFLYLRGERQAPMLEIVIPLIALAIIVYVLYQNTLADSLEYPYTVFPLIVAGWLVLGFRSSCSCRASPAASARASRARRACAWRGATTSSTRATRRSGPPAMRGKSQSASGLPVSSSDLRSESDPRPAAAGALGLGSPATIEASVGAPSSSWMTVSLRARALGRLDLVA